MPGTDTLPGMRLGLNLGYWGAGNDAGNLALAQEADRLGYSVVWAAEAYGSDAPTVLSWVARFGFLVPPPVVWLVADSAGIGAGITIGAAAALGDRDPVPAARDDPLRPEVEKRRVRPR